MSKLQTRTCSCCQRQFDQSELVLALDPYACHEAAVQAGRGEVTLLTECRTFGRQVYCHECLAQRKLHKFRCARCGGWFEPADVLQHAVSVSFNVDDSWLEEAQCELVCRRCE